MNMKKSIAGVAAGAMAISAMATVASANVVTHPANEDATRAREQIVLTYDLATYTEAYKPTNVKLITTYSNSQYNINGVVMDKINGGAGLSAGGQDTGYTVVLGHVLNQVGTAWGTVHYYLQTVELNAKSVQHNGTPSATNPYPGQRSSKYLWYSRVNLGKDLSDMQNENAAVEDHNYLDVLTDDKGNEYAFKVKFEVLRGTSNQLEKGTFVLDQFYANENQLASTGHTFPAYTLVNAQAIQENGNTAVNKEGKTVAPMAAADAQNYQIVAIPGTDATKRVASTGLVKAQVTNAITAAQIASSSGLSNAFPDDLATGFAAGTPIYYKGNGQWTSDRTNAKRVELTKIESVNETSPAGTAFTPVSGSDMQKELVDAAASLATIEASKDSSGTQVLTVGDITTTVASTEIAVKGTPATLGTTPEYFIVTKASVAANPTAIDPDIPLDGTPVHWSSFWGDNVGPYVVINREDIGKLTHWSGVRTDIAAKNVYCFETFTVTSTFQVQTNGWDNANNYTGSTDKFTPVHVGIRRAPDTTPDKSLKYTDQDVFQGTTAVSAATNGAYEKVAPMRSDINRPADVVLALKARKTGNKHYTSPITVLNDVIANNEEVSFKFISSARRVRNCNWVEVKLKRKASDGGWMVNFVNPVTKDQEVRHFASNAEFGKYDNKEYLVLPEFGYIEDVSDVKTFDWYNPTFGQHLYTNASYGILADNGASFTPTDYSNNGTGYTNGYGYPVAAYGDTEMDAYNGWTYDGSSNNIGNYGSYNYGGWNTNLFNGGLVINQTWTMQLSDTKHFDWGENSLTFFWSEIKNKAVTNANQFLVSMLLYTPVEWYWDTLEVGVGAAAAPGGNVATTAGQEDDGAEIDDEEIFEEVVEEEDEEEIFEDFEEEEPEEEDFGDEEYEEEDFGDEEYTDEDYTDEEEYFDDYEDYTDEEGDDDVVDVVVVEEVKSPKTGNSPIALAVIPVALAAAAIVAKKKND